MHPALHNARELWGRKRFFPPGQHPATERYRRHLALLEQLPPSENRDAAVEHIKQLLANFEATESESKSVFLRRQGLS